MSTKIGKIFLLWIWTTFFIPFIVWPHTPDSLNSPQETFAPKDDLAPPLDPLLKIQNIPAALEAKEELKAAVRIEKKPYLPSASFSENQGVDALAQALAAAENLDPQAAELAKHNALTLCLHTIAEGKSQERQTTPDLFNEELSQGMIKIPQIPEGESELNLVDGIKFPKVIPVGTEIDVIFMNEDRVHPDSRHVRRIIASHRVDGGRNRQDGLRGRTVIIAWYKNGNDRGFSQVTKTDVYLRHEKMMSRGWWRDYLLYLDNPFKRDHWFDHVLFMGLTFGGLLQMDVVAWVRNLELLNHPSIYAGYEKIFFTGLFGAFWGVFSTQLRRAVSFPQKDFYKALVHAGLTSLTFGFLFKLIDPEQGAKVFDMTSSVGWRTLADLVSIVWITNGARIGPYKSIALLNRERKNVRRFMGTSMADWQTQFSSVMILMPPRLIDLGVSWAFTLSVAGAIALPISAGKLILIALWPAGQYFYTRLAEVLKVGDANQIRMDWEKSVFGFSLGLPLGTAGDIAMLLKDLTKLNVEVAREVFDQEDAAPEVAEELVRSRLLKISERWQRQRLAPKFHAGRITKWFGDLLRPSDMSTPEVHTSLRGKCSGWLSRIGRRWKEPFEIELAKIKERKL